jgi:DNA primase
VKPWIDFRAVKKAADGRFGEILARYGLAFEAQGGELVGLCPFHEERNPSCRVNPTRGVFHCFGCGAKGSVLDFVAQKEATSITNAAALVAGWFGIAADGERRRRDLPSCVDASPPPSAVGPSETDCDWEENPPLASPLSLDPTHPYLAARGLSSDIIRIFGLGFSADGEMRGRIAIPIHDHVGRLVAYAGRFPGIPPDRIPRYRFPKGFKKRLALFNIHRVAGESHLVLVEGFFGAIHLYALGIPAVALMGTSLSARQQNLLVQSGAVRLTLLLDGDVAGRNAARDIAQALIHRNHVRVAHLLDGKQPDTENEDELRRRLATG